MSSTSSRILRAEELTAVAPIWWREAAASPQPHRPREARLSPEPAEQSARDKERGEQEAYQRGFAEGKAIGREQSAADVQATLERLTRGLAELSTLRSRIRKDAEGDLLKLAITIARRVLHRELTLDPESIEGLIKVALEKLQSRELCRVRVHPDQEPAIRASLERFSNSHKVELLPDPSMQCGDVLFETAHGNLDASIESQLREIERGFADRLQR